MGVDKSQTRLGNGSLGDRVTGSCVESLLKCPNTVKVEGDGLYSDGPKRYDGREGNSSV